MTRDDAQRQWQQQTLAYAQAINAYVERGLRDGWDNAGKEPSAEGREVLVPHLLDALRDANRNGQVEALRDAWPPAHEPLFGHVNEEGQCIAQLALLDDGSVLARIGATWEAGRVVRIHADRVEELPGLEYFGACPNRRFYATADAAGVVVREGWEGPEVLRCAWPRGTEDAPEGVELQPIEGFPRPTRLQPFPDGRRVLLVSADGIFVLAADGARRLYPDNAMLLESAEPDEPQGTGLSMEHGAVSADGRWIAFGAQDGRHQLFDGELNSVAQIGPHGEYPHFALFSGDGRSVAFNACHFYNGGTIAVDLARAPGLDSDYYEDVEGVTLIEPGARVYAGVSMGDRFVLGDAYGYLRCVDAAGNAVWQHYLGSTLSAMDLSADGRTLVAASYAGVVSIIDLEAGRPAWQIGTGNHRERRRWLFWKSEESALAW
ncbi:WD40 repeat domain-containing protein [Metapseudomonas otitidis]|uniref:WD40 repeat domain-containing protein n=1 Tax=Metapseudomonas otitidis TaxID=319939 RepID=UPI001AAEA61A|nr:hypothetical protein [Pseudomonas otitidis]MBO2928826.1 hypothetical protein [Pseudomonas otitidis]